MNTKESKELKLPDDHVITDWSGDDTYFLTTSSAMVEGKLKTHLHRFNQNGTEQKGLTDGNQFAMYGRFSPDGTSSALPDDSQV